MFQLNQINIIFIFIHNISFAVIEVASGEYGDDVVARLHKAWTCVVEEGRQSDTSSDRSSCRSGKALMSSILQPDCTVKSVSKDDLIHAASQTTQVLSGVAVSDNTGTVRRCDRFNRTSGKYFKYPSSSFELDDIGSVRGCCGRFHITKQ